MIVKRVIPSGYCKGVVNAIKLATKTREQFPKEKIYILGMIVHNSFVTEELNKLNIITLDDTTKTRKDLINELKEGILILTAHGTSDELKDLAIKKGLRIIDCTCEDVLKTKNIILKHLNTGYDVIYYGIKNHPEANAITSISKNIHLISNENDIKTLNISNDKILLTNQTTMSIFDLENIINEVKNKYPNVLIQKEICNATTSRQQAIMEIKDANVLYVVGDKKSNNTNKLLDISKKCGIEKVYLIANKEEINIKDLNNNDTVYVTAGASTPPILIDEVINYLNSLN